VQIAPDEANLFKPGIRDDSRCLNCRALASVVMNAAALREVLYGAAPVIFVQEPVVVGAP
jgi:hypothetical protein